MPMKAREAIKRLKKDGWYEVRQTGSNKQFRHPGRHEIVVVPDHPGDLKPGVEHNIRKIAGWE